MRAVSFVMRYSKCKPDLCSMAQTMGLFGLTTKSPHLFARGAVGWRLFTKSGGVTPFAQAMPGLGRWCLTKSLNYSGAHDPHSFYILGCSLLWCV